MNTLSGFLRRAQHKLLNTPWQIIQIAETNEPGMFRLWALVDKELHQLRLIVPRIFYVNTKEQRKEPEESVTWKKCSRILPRSRPVYHLYRYCVPESIFKVHGLELFQELSKPEIEGIYETQMSLEFRAILDLGCVCMVDASAASGIADGADTFSLDQLQYKSIAVQPYLEKRSGMKHIFLYHHWSTNHQRAIWGLFLSPSKRAHIFVLDTVRTNQMPNLNNLFVNERRITTENTTDGRLYGIPEEMHFDVRIETNFQTVCRSLQAALKAYKSEMKGATMLAVQTPMDMSELTSDMPLLNDFPVINTRNRDPENLYNTLDWQKIGATKMIRSYLNSENVLELMIQTCRYFHAPLGNIPADHSLFGADLFYARNLQQHNFVLWWSSTERPDLGGSENDDNRLLTDFEESSSCAVNYPGVYSSVCMELEIESLAVNTLMQTHRVHDAEGTNAFVGFHTAPQASLTEMVTGESTTASIPSYDETALCSAAFKILRVMVNMWVRDVSIHRNAFADHQLIHFYRWLRSPNAFLYDPALRRTLYNNMKKMFLQLLVAFKESSARIVFANFNKIIICTKKRSIENALGYTDGIVRSIKNKDLFHGIGITCEACWEYLVWLDLPNHAGVKGKLPEEEEEEEDEDDVPEVVMNWNLMKALPKEASCQESFSAIIAGYIITIYQYINESQPASATPRRRKRRDSALSQTISTDFGVGTNEDIAQFAKKLISGQMSQKLFQIVQKINKALPEKIMTFEENPNLDMGGARSKKINPALELIKAVVKILSLDKEVENEVDDLQRNLLRLIKVGSFSDNAEWKDPCISFVLPEVICKACNHTRDVDLCKDNYTSVTDGM